MRLPKRVLQKVDSQLASRINELYHDLENTCYDERHTNMAQSEQIFWENIAKEYLAKKEAIVCVDYGSGTGFVPLITGQYLKKEDSLVCSDISIEMVNACQANLEQISLVCKCSFLKIDANGIRVGDNSVDIITVNSVLHHVFDLNSLAKEFCRILKPGGTLIVAHEPNSGSKLPFPAKVIQLVAKLIFRPKSICFFLVENIPLLEGPARRVLSKVSKAYRRRNKMLTEITRQLKKEKLLDFDLRGTELQQIVDYHTQNGFDIAELLAGPFQKFELVEFQTYNHLGFASNKKVARSMDQYLRRHWPYGGKQLRFVLRCRH